MCSVRFTWSSSLSDASMLKQLLLWVKSAACNDKTAYDNLIKMFNLSILYSKNQ